MRRAVLVAALLLPVQLLATTSACTNNSVSNPADPPPAKDVAGTDAPDPGPEAERQLAELGERVVTGYLARDPVAATTLGEHGHDERWPDLSDPALTEHSRWIADELATLATIPHDALTPDSQVELDLIRLQLDRWQFEIEVEQVWRSDPLAYAELIATGLEALTSSPGFAPIDTQAASLAGRLEQLGVLVDQAIANLDDPARLRRPATELAVARLAELAVWIDVEIPTHMASASPALRERITAASEPAKLALAKLQAHLAPEPDHESKSKSKSEPPPDQPQWRLGPELFARKLALSLAEQRDPDALRSLAKTEHERVRQDIHTVGRELYEAMWGAQALARLDSDPLGVNNDAIVRAVLRELGPDHPSAAELRDAAEASLARLQEFVGTHALVPIDEGFTVEVVWAEPSPGEDQPQVLGQIEVRGPLATGPSEPSEPSHSYRIQPLPDDWSRRQTESYLREHNSFVLELRAIHEVMPGRAVQRSWAEREPSTSTRARQVFANPAFVAGWAVYAERVMVEAGYAAAGPAPSAKQPTDVSAALWTVQRNEAVRAQALRLVQLTAYLATVGRAIVDLELHAGAMARTEAIAWLRERGFETRAEAEAAWTDAQVHPTLLSTAFVGALAWSELRTQAEARAREAGRDFDLLAFHRDALAHGEVPVDRLPALMGW